MLGWVDGLSADPLPALLGADDAALVWSVRHDLLADGGDPRSLWNLPLAAAIVRRQRPDGSWRYPGKGGRRSHTDYDQLATYEALLALVQQHRLDARHPALARAADFLLGFQTREGDLRGIYGCQYTPNYTAAIIALLVEAGLDDDPRIDAALRWLLRMRQDDHGWALPFRTLTTVDTRSFKRVLRLSAPLEPDRSKPFSHLITGIVLRALAAHIGYRARPEARLAATLLASRLFKADPYPDRRDARNWEKLRYPFRWTDVVSALDAMLLTGMDGEDPAVSQALVWLAERQGDDGLWRSTYAKAADPHVHHWTSFACARVFHRAHGDRR